MTPVELLALFRSEMSDTEETYFWSNSEFYTYLDDAQKMFCRLTDGISDASTKSVVELAFTPGTEWFKLHRSILKIRTAIRVSNGKPVSIYNVEDMATKGMRFDARTGPLTALIEGMEENKARAYPTPSDEDTIRLTVFRLPLTTVDKDAELEIAEQHHINLLDWVKYRAYSKQDAETLDKNKARDFEDRFRAYCNQAKLEQQRKRHKVRTVNYGGLEMQNPQFGDAWWTKGYP